MRLVFAGTPAFAAVALRALLESGYEIVLVLTQPDRPSGRGMRLAPSEVKQLAVGSGLPIFQPSSLKSQESQDRIRSAGAEVMVVAAYGLLLPLSVLEMFPLGCINIHASILPRWRGAAPIQRAILAGDGRTGISIMRMEEGLDTGPVYLEREIEIAPDDTAGTLHEKLASLGARCIVESLPRIADSTLQPTRQTDAGVTYARKIEKHEAVINWGDSATEIARQIRAFNPFPGASTTVGGESLKIWKARAGALEGARPGQIIDVSDGRLIVCCGTGSLSIIELQRAGGKRLSTGEFLRGAALPPGAQFGS
jgi:methionyl-tRNA formyltransferase